LFLCPRKLFLSLIPGENLKIIILNLICNSNINQTKAFQDSSHNLCHKGNRGVERIGSEWILREIGWWMSEVDSVGKDRDRCRGLVNTAMIIRVLAPRN
jgi:hypothetical protein